MSFSGLSKSNHNVICLKVKSVLKKDISGAIICDIPIKIIAKYIIGSIL